MRLSINLLLSLTIIFSLPPTAQAQEELAQVKSRHASTAESLWSTLLASLRGKPVQAAGDLTVKVTDSMGTPLRGASVLVGTAAGQPFSGNLAQTDAEGKVAFSGEALRQGSPLPVTAFYPGLATVSLLDNRDNQVEIALSGRPEERSHAFLRGKVLGFPPGYGGDMLELGFFVPAARPEALMNFDIQGFISSYKVKIDIYGEREIPGNVVLPTQTKYYNFFPVSLSKPEFIMPLPSGLKAHMFGLVGAVPISRAADAIQRKDFLAVLNMATITHTGWTRDRVEVTGDDSFDITANQRINPNAVTAQLSGLTEKLDAVAVSLFDPKGDKGDYISMDIKSIKSESMPNGSGSVRLGTIAQSSQADNFHVFTALFDRNQIQNSASHWIVGSVQPVQRRATVPFNGFMNPVRPVSADAGRREFRFSAAASSRITPDLTIINIVSEKDNPATQGVDRKVLWTAVVRGGVDQLALPDLGRPLLPTPDQNRHERFRWEVSAVRGSSASVAGEFDLKDVVRNLQDVSSLSQAF